MGKVKVNFGDVQDFEALPEGTYQAVIEKIEYREPTEAGKAPYLNVEYTVTEGTEDEHVGRKVWEVLSWSPKALFRMRDFFEAAGFGWDDEDDHDLDIDEDSNLLIDPDLTGEAVELVLENEIYKKKEVNRVASIEFLNPPGDEDDEEEEAPAPKKGAKTPAKTSKSKAAEPEEDDEEEEEEDDEDEEEDEEEEDEPAPKKSTKASPAKTFRPTTTGAKRATGKKPAKRTFR